MTLHFAPMATLALLLTASAAAQKRGAPGENAPERKPPAGEKDEKNASACIAVEKEARYIAGYDHLVHLTSTCDRLAVCGVSTNVNPEVQTVEVPPGTKKTVLTFRGSPASTFEAKVECTFADSKGPSN